MSRQLMIQRGIILLVILTAFGFALAAILSSNTTAPVKVIVIGVLAGLIAGGLIAAARGGQQ